MAINNGIWIGAAGAAVVAGLGIWGWTSGKLPMMIEGVRAVDFRNASIEVFGTACANPALTSAAVPNVTVKDGSYDLGQYHFELMGDTKYGDVSGQTNEDAGEKAVFVATCNQGGQTSQVLFVYGIENSKPARLATLDLSNGNASLVQSYSVGNGTIQVKQNQGDPPQLTTLSYVLLNGKLENVGGGTPAVSSSPTVASNDEGGTDTVSFQYFKDHLTQYGTWIDHPHWGQVWHPTAVPASFRPYRNGHWENTADYGMIWVSNEDFGDIVYHYGRWVYDPDDAWIWVPGYVWSPSWVVWRTDNTNVGWMPMPPGDYDGDGDYPDDYAGWYGYRGWDPGLDEAAFVGMWSFVGAADLLAASVDAVAIAPDRVRLFIGRTHGWTRYAVERGRVVDRAFEAHRFAAAFHRSLPLSARHDFMRGHVPMAGIHAGRAMAAREHFHSVGTGGHFGEHGLAHSGLGHAGGFSHGSGVAHSSGFGHSSGFARSGTGIGHTARSSGFGHSSGFARSGTGIGHTARSGGFGRSSGFAHSGGGSSGFGRSSGYGSSGFGHSAGGFGRSGSGGSSFGHSTSGGFGGGNAFGGQHAAAPHFSSSSGHSGGGGGRHR